MKAIVLLSGGLDSATALYWTMRKGFRPLCLIFDYGQKHVKEIRCAESVAKKAGVPREIVGFRLPWGGSSLTDPGMKLPRDRSPERMAGGGIPSTYVPARNTIFLSFALSYADAAGARAVVIGANAVDYSGYPDCRPAYLRAVQRAASLGTRTGAEGGKIRILAPLVRMTKGDIVRLGTRLGAPYALTWSCYRGGAKPCRRCDSCLIREKGFREAGIPDPALAG